MEQQCLPPGFRFSPTDDELVMYYLKNRACGKEFRSGVIAEVDIYEYEPWELSEKSAQPSPDLVWYFFNAQYKRLPHSARINRKTSKGYWKATGKDRKIFNGPHIAGIKKTLIYYKGRAPSGQRTDWVMHEYKLDEDYEKKSKATCSPALCRIRKKGSLRPKDVDQSYNECIEWVGDVDDAVHDESFSAPSPKKSEFTPAFFQPEAEKEISPDCLTEDSGLDDFLFFEGLGTSTDFDTSFGSSFAEDPEVRNLEAGMVSSAAAIDRTQRGHIDFNWDIVDGLPAIWDQAIVNDDLQPPEEDILEEMLRLVETGECPSTQAFCHIDDDPCAYSRDVSGGFIEIRDMDSPLFEYVPGSPNDYGIKQQQLPPELCDDEARFGCPPVLVNTQGLAARRIRLQVTPHSSAIETNFVSSGSMEKISLKVPGSSGIMLHAENIGSSSSQLKESSIVPDSDANSMTCVSLAKLQAGKESQEVETSDFLKKMMVKPFTSDLVLFSPLVVSKTGRFEECLDCGGEGGLLACADAASHYNHTQPESFDCEAGPSSRLVPGNSSKVVHTSSNDGAKDVWKLSNKLKAITLGSQVNELESKLSTMFNDRVFALGKPVARLLPSSAYVNPYHSLKSVLRGFICRIGLALLVILFVFFWVHILAKFV